MFDTVNHDILLEKLEYYGIRGLANNWQRSFFKNRKQYVSLHGVSSSIKIITCGVPQGSTLGPLLFLLYINDLKCAFSKSIIHNFADDTDLIFLSKKLGTIECVINNELKHLVQRSIQLLRSHLEWVWWPIKMRRIRTGGGDARSMRTFAYNFFY